MVDCRETPLDGQMEILGKVDGWTRSPDPAKPRGQKRTLLPGTYPVVAELHERQIVDPAAADRQGIGHFAAHFYGLDTGEVVFVSSRDGAFTPA